MKIQGKVVHIAPKKTKVFYSKKYLKRSVCPSCGITLHYGNVAGGLGLYQCVQCGYTLNKLK